MDNFDWLNLKWKNKSSKATIRLSFEISRMAEGDYKPVNYIFILLSFPFIEFNGG